MNDTAVVRPGWPTETGPLKTLTDLGMLPQGTRHLPWTSESSTQSNSGTPHYRAKCNFLPNAALRALAALTLEGWHVTVQPAGPNLKITISAQKTL